MRSASLRNIVLGLLFAGTAVSGYYVWQTNGVMHAVMQESAAHAARLPSAYTKPSPAETDGGAPILVGLDDIVANIGPNTSSKSHMLIVKLNFELFEEDSRKLIEKRQGGVKHTILELARHQNLNDLKTLSGKLYFKEEIISRVNAYLHQPAIRDIHFASFLLR